MRKLLTLSLALFMVLCLSASAFAERPDSFEPGPKLGDVRVRQALLYALDRENFILAEYGSPELARVGLAPISPTSWAFPDESQLNPYAFDLDKANALLDEAGWVMGADGYRYKDGEKLALKWLVYTDSSWPGTLSSMAFDSWKQIGVELNIELMDFNTVSDRTMDAKPGEKDFDIYTMGFSLSIDPDPSGALFDYAAFTEGGFNASGFYDERGQELIKLGLESFDQAERQKYYQEWALLMNELVPTTIVAYRSEIWGVNQRVKGMDMNAYMKWDDIIEKITLEGDQILKFAETSFEGKFNSIMSDNVYDSYICDLVFEGLIANNHEAEIIPNLATWELSEDHKTYTFTLKDGITFADGTPLTTDDVLFTYMMIAHPNYTGPRLDAVSDYVGYEEYAAGTAETISGINVIDEKTISFTFKTPSPANIEKFSYGILPRAYYEADTFEGFLANLDKPMGSGKMVVEQFEPGQMIMMRPNENYWDKDNAVQIEGVYITMMPDESKVAALQLGEIDFAQLTAKKTNVEAVEAMDGVDLLSYLGNGYTFMCFNTLH